jgi:cytochrome oxidase Cu insertion factor (SCO1/SenC/PrrC family)
MTSHVRRSFPTLIATLGLSTGLCGGLVETVAPQLGRAAAPVSWTDETGRLHQLSEFAGYPIILLPVYTRCRTACVTNLGHLKAALSETSADPTQFRVLLFSFDPTDTPAVLASYRANEKIPLGWSVGTASREDIAALLESIGFQYGQAGKEFTHPNMLVFLDSNLRIAKWIYGDNYSSRDVDAALRVAAGESDWIGRHSDVLYALLLFAASICCVALSYYVLQLILLRRASRTQAANQSF